MSLENAEFLDIFKLMGIQKFMALGWLVGFGFNSPLRQYFS